MLAELETLTAIVVVEQRSCSIMDRGVARETGGFPEQANCSGGMLMPRRRGGKGCVHRHASNPGLTLTRHRSAGC